jgi:GNAT superfamily N-acetyltransferase
VQIRDIDVDDDADVLAWWEVGKAVDAYGRDHAAYWSLRAATVALRDKANSFQQLPIAAFDGDQVVGIDKVMLPLLDNTHLAFVEPMVLPEHRGRGVGSSLLAASLEKVRAARRRNVLCEINLPLAAEPESPYLRFARKHGFELGILDIHRVLDLPVASQRLAELAVGAAPHHRDFRLVSWDDEVPDEYLDGYCELQVAFNSEAPMGDLELENEVWDEERVRSAEARFRAQGRREVSTVAIGPDGKIVGLTQMMTTEETPDIGWQGGTLVLKAARGHRLGMATKVANLVRFQERLPEVTTVHSWNAEENGPMVAINETLGFRPVERLAEMQLRL